MVKIRSIALMLIVVLTAGMVAGQGFETEFGKNRVQYHDDFKDWWMYESENFIMYWYGKARNVAHASMQIAEMDYNDIVNIIEHRTNEKIEIIAYVDITDMKQSNIGSEEQFSQTAGKTKIVGNKMFVYFNGDHQHLRQQIRKGIASIILDAMLYGGNFQEIVQNAVFLNVPKWFREGLISYIARDWSPEIESDLIDIFQTEKDDGFEDLAYEYPEVIGHSFWYFIGERYGKSSIANILYLTRINRDLSNAFLYVIGTPLARLMEEWEIENEERRSETMRYSKRNELPFRVKKGRLLTHVSVHPKTGKTVYATNQMGKVRVYLQRKNQRDKRFLKFGYCNQVQSPDLNYPLFSWTPSGDRLFVIFEKRDVIILRNYNSSTWEFEEQIFPNDIQRIYDFDVTEKGELYFTGANNGLSDVFRYIPKSRQYQKITDDFYDDLEIEYVVNEDYEGILFTSNRPNTILIPRLDLDTILPLANRDIFYYDLKNENNQLVAITDNTLGDKKQLEVRSGQKLSFLSSKSGIWNQRLIDLGSVMKEYQLGGSIEFGYDGIPITDYNKNIVLSYLHPRQKTYYDILKLDEGYVQIKSIANFESDEVDDGDLGLSDTEQQEVEEEKEVFDYQYFESPFDNPEIKVKNDEDELFKARDNVAEYQYNNQQGKGDIPKFIFPRAIASRTRFKIDYFNTNLDNSLMFGGLDTYAGTKREFENPPLGILLKANLKDIFEDYVIEGGTRIATSFNGSENFLTFIDKKYRIDKHYSIYRRSFKNLIETGEFAGYRGRNITLIGVAQFRYPFDVYRSLRTSATFRNDRFNILSTDRVSLNAPSIDEQRVGLKVEYVFDNTIDLDINIKNGTRYKIYTEVIKRFALDIDPWNLDFNEGFMNVIGWDFRHYLPVLKHSVLAFRAHGATSFGSERILFFAGGMQNWLFPSFNQNTTFPPEDNYAYQTIATNLRGFQYNVRNGGTFALINTEFRLPLVKYFTKRKLKFAPLQHLQFSGFFDMGLAWFGVNPLARDNPANSDQFSNPAVTVDVQYYRDPLIMGYGWGVRTLVFGYYLKFDYAYGLETRRVQDPVWYLSLGTDF